MSMEILLSTLPLALVVAMLKSIAELDSASVQAYATIILAVFNSIFIAILVWDRWSDKPKLEIKMEDKAKIYSYEYAIGFSVLNKGRKDAHNCSVSVQVFDRESGKKIKEDSRPLSSGFMPDSGSLSSVLRSGAMGSFTLHYIFALNGTFVARISAKTHKSKANKIVEYEIRNGHDPIIFKWGFVPYFRFHLRKCLLKKYRNEWGTEFFAHGLKIFLDPKIRQKLAQKLGEIGGDKAISPLIDCLKIDPSTDVRDRAADALGNIGDKKAVGPLLKCLRENEATPYHCARAIAKICDQEWCAKELIDILHETDTPQKRGAVAESLGEIGEKIRDENIENALIEVLDRFGGDNFCDGVKALGKVGGEKALKKLESMEQCCGDIFKKAIEQIQFRISVGGDHIEEK